MQPAARPGMQVVLAVIGSICATLVTNALDTSPAVSLIGAALGAAIPALVGYVGPYQHLRAGAAILVTAGALIVTYGGFTLFDYAADRPETFPLPEAAPKPNEEVGPTDGDDGPTDLIPVPGVVGELYAAAEEELRNAGLSAERDDEDIDSAEPLDTVVQQDPAEGEPVQEGETITLAVSQEPVEVVVPDVVGKTEAEARAELESSRFAASVTASEGVDDPSLDGKVVRQTPDRDTLAKPGDTVELTVGEFVIP